MKITINIPRIMRYFRQNLGIPFVIVFQILLLSCAVLLIWGYSNLANGVAIYGYYSLVIGVVLQLVSFLRLDEFTRVLVHTRERPLFVIVFQILLLSCAVLLIWGYSNLANEVAIYGYYSLVIGVIMHLVSFLRHGERAVENEV